jgi:hypothetical protein
MFFGTDENKKVVYDIEFSNDSPYGNQNTKIEPPIFYQLDPSKIS